MEPHPSSLPTSGIVVTCLVLIDATGAVLATQRPEGKRLAGKWEFPGGKVEPGESPESALRREIEEELRLAIRELAPLPAVEHDYDFGAITLLPFISHCETRPALHLVEHTASRWVTRPEWDSLDWAPADVPVLTMLDAASLNADRDNVSLKAV